MAKRSDRTSADTLIELLGKLPDVATLEILIEPEHLLKLLRAHGWTDDDIRRDLTRGGQTPGELLLAVLAKQPDARVLLDLLGNPPPPVSAPAPRAPSPGRLAAPATSRSDAQLVGMVIMGVLLAASSGWILFVKLDFWHVPQLMFHFRGAYTLLFSALVGGLLLIGLAVRTWLRRER